MKKTVIIILILVLVLGALSFALLSMASDGKISKQEALEIALSDAGVDVKQLTEKDVDYESELGNKWYEVEFETLNGTEYEYRIDAFSGEILASRQK